VIIVLIAFSSSGDRLVSTQSRLTICASRSEAQRRSAPAVPEILRRSCVTIAGAGRWPWNRLQRLSLSNRRGPENRMSQYHRPVTPDREIREAENQIAQQKALVRRRIVQGTPSQGEEDRLGQLERALLRIKEQRLHKRSSELQRKVRDRSR
jgi:hypothetical protein